LRREALLWLASAEEDLEDAKIAFELGRWFRVAFFSQQAVEKALEAPFFVVLRKEPPKTHIITELYKQLKEAGFRLDIEDELYFLNKYYIVTRYPDAANGLPSESVDRWEAERALKIAERVIEVVRGFVTNS